MTKSLWQVLGLLDKNGIRNLFVGLGVGGFTQGVVFLLLLVVGGIRLEGFVWSVSTVVISFVAACLVAWQEGLEYRAYTIENLKVWGYWFPIAVSAIIYVVPHYSGRGFDNPTVYVSIFLLGVLAAFAYIVRGSLYVALGFHIGFNFASDTLLSGQIVRVQNRAPDWKTEMLTWIALGLSALLLVNLWKRLEKKHIRVQTTTG